MNQQITISSEPVSFKEFLFKNSTNRKTIILAGIAIIIQFVIFKFLYPYASYIHGDSFVYLRGAHENLGINTYPIGYSKFLRLLSVFTNSDTTVVGFQYLFVQISALFFLLTLFYFYSPGKLIQRILLIFMVGNPLLLYMANMISSDCLFLSLSLIWFALLIWTIHSPFKGIIVLNTLVLFLAFTVRYNALIYPLISIFAFTVSKLSTRRKLFGALSLVLVCTGFILHTGYKYKSLTGTWQFSPFSGWQLTNNAMYAYRYVDSAKRKPVPEKFKVLDQMIREYFDSTRDVRIFPFEELQASTVYMWTKSLTLYKFRDNFYNRDSTASEFKKWAAIGPLYKSYGLHMIKKYPWHYVRYFLWPNSIKYYAPPVEFLSIYNSESDSVAPIAQLWFRYKSPKVYRRFEGFSITTLDYYPILTGTINVVFVCSLICFFILKGNQKKSYFNKGLLLSTVFWVINAAFTIFASSVALRFQAFPILLVTTFALLLIDFLPKIVLKGEAVTESPGVFNQISGREISKDIVYSRNTIVVEAITFLYVILFLYTAINKLSDYTVFREQIAMSPILEPIAPYIARLLPIYELLITALLIVPRWRIKGLYASLMTMIFFTLYIILILTFNKNIPCSCGGFLEQLSWTEHIIFNVFFIALAIVALKFKSRLSKESKLDWLSVGN